MNKAEAINTVVESAKFWRSETIRLEGADGLRTQSYKDLDGITAADSECQVALFVLGAAEFLKEFNDEYMAE